MTAPRFKIDDVLVAPRGRRRLLGLPGLVRRAFGLVWAAAPRELLTSAALQVLSGAAVAVQLIVARDLLSELLSGDGADRFGAVTPELIALGLVTTFVTFAALARTEQQRVLGELVGRHAARHVIAAANAADLLSYEDPVFHDRLQRASVNAAMRPLQMTNGVLGVLASIPAIIGIGIVLVALQPVFFLLVLVAYLPVWVASSRASAAYHSYTVRQTGRDRRRSYLYLVLTRREEATEVRTFGFGPWMMKRHDDLYDERIRELRQTVRKRLVFGFVGGLASSALTASTIGLLLWFVATDRIELAEAGAAAGAILLLGQRLQSLSGSAASLFESALFLEDYTSFVIDPAAAVTSVDEAAVELAPFASLRATGVGFTYPAANRPSLVDVDIEIRSGEVVALVGENGSGKTTLAKILAGLYAPSVGDVRWDGRALADLDQSALRASTTMLFQDFARYHLTAAENIGIGRHEDIDDRHGVASAARDAGANELISRLPEGYDTWLGPEFIGGTDLSIGQWQRVALARSFFRASPFVILDEPSSALDPRAEADLFDSIRSLCRGRSVLVISHRFSSVRAADRIYVLRGGRVDSHGTHDELMEKDGLYAELFTLQAAAYLGPTT